MKNIILSFLYYISLGIALFIVLYLYSDDYNFPWSTHDEGLRYLHFLTSVPIPLIVSLFSTIELRDIGWKKIKITRQVLLLLTFCSTTVYMMADGGSLGETKILIGFILGLAITVIFLLLPGLEIILFKRSNIKHIL